MTKNNEMKDSARRKFLGQAGVFALSGLLFAGCKTMETLEKNMGGILESSVSQVGGGKADLVMKSAKAIERNFTDFTPEQEYYIGRSVGAQILAKYPPYNNSKVNDFTNDLGQTLAQASDMPETFRGYHFLVQDSDEINAFAAPGGLIFITRGMIRCCDSEDAFAAVLAHEIGHVQHQHGIQSIQKSRVADTVAIIGVESAKQVGGGQLGQLLGLFEGSITDITKTLITDGYSRSYEGEADQAAINIMKRVGYNPASLMDMLRKMDKNLVPGRQDFSRTHPKPEERIQKIQEMIGSPSGKAFSVAREKRFKNFSGSI